MTDRRYPRGTTKLELRLEARFALRLLYDVSIVAPVAVLMILRAIFSPYTVNENIFLIPPFFGLSVP